MDVNVSENAPNPAARFVPEIQRAFAQAMAGESPLDPAILRIRGMSGRKYRYFINNLIRAMPDARYLEIGAYTGSTLCSAINGNRIAATAIDNWSQFHGPKDEFLKNLETFKTADAQVNFLEQEFRTVDFAALGKFNVYLYDGPHKEQDQYDAIAYVHSALDDEFILIVDDWNLPAVRHGTMRALQAFKLAILYSLEVRTTLDDSLAKERGNRGDWHNGYFFAVLDKRQMAP